MIGIGEKYLDKMRGAAELVRHDDGTVSIVNSDGTVMSVQPDGSVESRPAGTYGPWERGELQENGQVIVFNSSGHLYAFSFAAKVPA